MSAATTAAARAGRRRIEPWTLAGAALLVLLLFFSVLPMAWIWPRRSDAIRRRAVPARVDPAQPDVRAVLPAVLGEDEVGRSSSAICEQPLGSTATTVLGVLVEVPAAYALALPIPGSQPALLRVLVRNCSRRSCLTSLFIMMRSMDW